MMLVRIAKAGDEREFDLREPRLVDRAVGFDMVHRILKGIAVRHDAVVDFLPLKYALEHLHDERGRHILELAVAGVERRHRALVRYELAKRRELVARSVSPQKIGTAPGRERVCQKEKN